MAIAANILGVGNDRKKKLQFFKIAEFAIILFALLLTTKRAHLLFAVLAIIIVYCIVYASFRKILQLVPIIAVFIIVFTIISKYIPETMQTLNRFINQSDITNGRTLLWEIAWNTFKENPIIGIGWGGYPYLLSTKIIAGSTYGISYYAVNYMGAHNVYLQLLCETGILGFTFVVFILTTTFIKTFKTAIYVRKNTITVTSTERQVLTFSLMIQMFFFLYCVTGNPLYDRMVYIPYFLCCAVGMAMDKKYLKRSSTA
jgi:O-antigen ligase